jgi:hypothetical protein
MAQTDSSFNAKGPTVTAFETIDEGPRAFGVKVHSNEVCGVYGESMEFPPAVGDRENHVLPRTGVFGRADSIGVQGKGELVGVYGDTTSDTTGLGTENSSGIGIIGFSPTNRAGVFQCLANLPGADKSFLETVNSFEEPPGKAAQLRLVPYPAETGQPGEPQRLPKNGLAGDFFVVVGNTRTDEALIWFCLTSHDKEKGTPSVWGKISIPSATNRLGGDPASGSNG